MDLSPEEAAELSRLEDEFEALGGRGVELANRIDQLIAKRDWNPEEDSLGCPDCHNAEELYTVERLYGECGIVRAGADGITFDGWTELDWDSTTTLRLACRACGWSFEGTDHGVLVNQLAPPFEVE